MEVNTNQVIYDSVKHNAFGLLPSLVNIARGWVGGARGEWGGVAGGTENLSRTLWGTGRRTQTVPAK